MPAVPFYAHHLGEAIEALTGTNAEWIDRRQLEEILGTSKWTAWRLLKACAAEAGPGGALSIRRTELIERLEELRRDGRLVREIDRRTRLENHLDGIIRFARARHKEIARDQHALKIVSTRFASLPPGVTLTSRSLLIDFADMEDFLGKFGAVVYALHNDCERISDFIESGAAE